MSIKAMICSCCFDDKILANHNNLNHRAYVYGKHKAFQVEMGTVVPILAGPEMTGPAFQDN